MSGICQALGNLIGSKH